MAEGSKLVLYFKTSDDKTVQFSYGNAKTNASLANVTALGTAMITNTSIYPNTLTTLTRALIRTTTENEYTLPDSVSNRIINGNPELPDETTDDEVTTVEQIPYKKKE